MCLCRDALRDGLLAEAERHLDGFQAWERRRGNWRWLWARTMGSFALANGRRHEASRYFEIALEVARRLGDVWLEHEMLDRLKACEQPYPGASKRPANRTGGDPGKAKSEAKQAKRRPKSRENG
jgi:hypothetical protein